MSPPRTSCDCSACRKIPRDRRLLPPRAESIPRLAALPPSPHRMGRRIKGEVSLSRLHRQRTGNGNRLRPRARGTREANGPRSGGISCGIPSGEFSEACRASKAPETRATVSSSHAVEGRHEPPSAMSSFQIDLRPPAVAQTVDALPAPSLSIVSTDPVPFRSRGSRIVRLNPGAPASCRRVALRRHAGAPGRFKGAPQSRGG